MKKRTVITAILLGATILLLGMTVYISTLLAGGTHSPTTIQKTKAAAITYHQEVNIKSGNLTDSMSQFGSNPTPVPTDTTSLIPSATPALLAQAKPTLMPTLAPTIAPTAAPTTVPTDVPPTPVPSTQPSPTSALLAYNSTSLSPTPTLIPVRNTTANGGVSKQPSPTIVQTLPETGWVQTSTILFIVATTTIIFSLIF